MKKFFMLLALTTCGLQAQAKLDEHTILSEREETIQVDLSTTRVKLSNAGYPTPVVKVLVPELADVTLLDHRNPGEAAPCLATYDTVLPEDVVQGRPGVETVKIKIRLGKIPVINEQTKLCEMTLTEDIVTKIRGFEFAHSRDKVIATRPIEDCR